jgi:hypothetical protein
MEIMRRRYLRDSVSESRRVCKCGRPLVPGYIHNRKWNLRGGIVTSDAVDES